MVKELLLILFLEKNNVLLIERQAVKALAFTKACLNLHCLMDVISIKISCILGGIRKLAILTLCLLVSSADNLCKQFGSRPGPTNCWV